MAHIRSISLVFIMHRFNMIPPMFGESLLEYDYLLVSSNSQKRTGNNFLQDCLTK